MTNTVNLEGSRWAKIEQSLVSSFLNVKQLFSEINCFRPVEQEEDQDTELIVQAQYAPCHTKYGSNLSVEEQPVVTTPPMTPEELPAPRQEQPQDDSVLPIVVFDSVLVEIADQSVKEEETTFVEEAFNFHDYLWMPLKKTAKDCRQ